ncbi:hypothetical protein [Labilibacter marinus]|uniref:hypothetical protein n=1 Tax=Labilibacter marinus TaxID=1477105 RepID=UPI000835CA1C|nr:hypothetical protein [Labilibacter marinus]
MEKLILLTIILFFKISTYSQLFDNAIYVKGEIITISDTIECYISYQDYYGSIIKYKLEYTDKKAIKLPSYKVLYISTGMFNKFDRIYIKEKPHLMKRLCKGKISLYIDLLSTAGGMMPTAGGGFTITGGGSEEVMYLIKDYKINRVNRKKVNNLLKELMADDQTIQEKVNNFDRKDSLWDDNLKELVKHYNRNAKYNQ